MRMAPRGRLTRQFFSQAARFVHVTSEVRDDPFTVPQTCFVWF